MKKLIAILVCIFILAGSAFIFPIYQYCLSEIKLEAQLFTHSPIPASQLVTIRIAGNNADAGHNFKYTGENEFQYNGQMYDVVTATTSPHLDSVVYKCISDHSEDMLNQLFSDVLNSATDHANLPNNDPRALTQNCIKEFLVRAKLSVGNQPLAFIYFSQTNFNIAAAPVGDVPHAPPKQV